MLQQVGNTSEVAVMFAGKIWKFHLSINSEVICFEAISFCRICHACELELTARSHDTANSAQFNNCCR